MQVKNKKGEVFKVSQEHYETYKHDLELVTGKPSKNVKRKDTNECRGKATTKTQLLNDFNM